MKTSVDTALAPAFSGKNRKNDVQSRLQRSRERNRIHARKTRQRKKEQMHLLTTKADGLKQEQIRLKQCINEKNTASILVGLFSSKDSGDQRSEDPRVEALLRRSPDDIPDASKLPELPALILPGQHNSKKHKNSSAIATKDDLPDDGIDYDLLGKDRSKCTPAELDQIRRERNRMHAKRTRDRKRHFMEEMADMCKKLEEENDLLYRHLESLNGQTTQTTPRPTSVISPELTSTQHAREPSDLLVGFSGKRPLNPVVSKAPLSEHGVTFDQLKTLLEAASTFSSSVSTSAVSAASTHVSDTASLSDHEGRPTKRQKSNNLKSSAQVASISSKVPDTITTSAATAVGC